MRIPSDSELQEIVQRVLGRMKSDPDRGKLETEMISEEKNVTNTKIIALGADHGGYDLKEIIEAHMKSEGYVVIDCGTHNQESVDYPDFAAAVGRKVAQGEAWRGIIVDGAGIGSCMTANKINGVRAAMCYDHATAYNSREHNDANVLTLGAGLIGVSLAKQIVDTFINTEFGGGRHARRVDKIMAQEEDRE